MFDFTSTGLKIWSSIEMNVSCVRQQKDSYWQQWMATKYSFLSSEHYPLHCSSLNLSTGNHKTILSQGKVNCMPLYSNFFLVRSNFTEVHLFPVFSVLKSSLLILLVLGFGLLQPLWASVQGSLSLVTKQVLDNGTLSFLGYSFGAYENTLKAILDHLAGSAS